MRELVLDTLRRVSEYVRGNEDEFAQRVREASVVQQGETAKAHKKRIAKNEKRILELDMLFRKTYEDNAIGKLSDERFAQLSGAYETEQAELKQQNAALQTEVDSFDADSARADSFIGLIRKYTDAQELSGRMVTELIDHIEVYHAERVDGIINQRVRVFYNCIGEFEVPDWKNIPDFYILIETRKGVTLCYAEKAG